MTLGNISSYFVFPLIFMGIVGNTFIDAKEIPSVKINSNDWEGGAGSRAAGVLCLPNGGYEKADFLPFIPVAESSLHDAMMSLKIPDKFRTAVKIEFVIIAVKMKLCAKKYGSLGKGKRNAMTGSATYQTLVKGQNSTGELVGEVRCDFEFDNYKKKPSTDGVIFVEGLKAAYLQCMEST